ncbi:hypothetical protein ACQUW5_09570 [Legionella sp. CNM-1927-20]|uniref:hypothetical protein n=1 Tax=Legionella sp. CNM-1927-20 TaxID=3422221 RepID=UPI00403B2B29
MTKLNSISSYIEQKETFIDTAHHILDKTPDKQERMVRLTAFNTLLLFATYAKPHELESQIKICFPENDSESQNTINYISEQLRDLNYLCVAALSDTDNTSQQNTMREINFFKPEIKFSKEELSKALIEMVLKTTKNISLEESVRLGPS